MSLNLTAALDPAEPADAAPAAHITLRELYRQMWRYAAGARGRLVVSALLLTGSALVKLLAPWLTAQAIETLQRAADGRAAAACLPWVGAIVGVYVLSWALHGPGRVLERSVGLRVRRALTDRLYARLVEAPLAWHGTHHSAELAHRMAQASNALSNFTQSQFVYLQTAVNLVGPLVALTLLSRLTGGVALAGFVAVALTIVAFDRAMMRLARQENDAERRHGAALLDCLTNILTVLSLRLQAPTRRLLAHRLDAVMTPLRRSMALGEWKWCAVDLLTIALSWSLVALHAWHTRDAGALLLGSVFMVYQYAQQAGGVVGSLASNLQTFARMRADFASAAPIWAAPTCAAAPAGASEPMTAPLEHGWQQIDLCDLGCEPAGGDSGTRRGATLRNITLRLHAGERLALVGPSGAGKSTLLRLMAGLIEPTHGHVEVDGIPRFGLRDLRAASTLIAQEAQVFEATVRENLVFDEAEREPQIAAAARIASLDAVIDALPLGLATPITQGGANLSGGQRQRLCLARGVLAARDSSVLLLDEPTSALDPMTEALVYDRLDAAFPQACIVASVHRLSLLPRFDRIVLIEQGRVVDVGRADELRLRQPLFRELIAAEGSRTTEEPVAN